MKTVKELSSAFEILRQNLAETAEYFAEQGVTANRRHMKTVCLTAQAVQTPEDRRFEFRTHHDEAYGYSEIRMALQYDELLVEFRPTRSKAFADSMPWEQFDTLSQIMILEGLERAKQTKMP